ncbi:MAG: adenosylmethionine--8-amino-7-oxononanoate transaminase [Chitinispirillaceae bacterium]
MLSKENFDRLWMPFTCHEDNQKFPPPVIERGSGIYLYDENGKEYIDATGSWWTSIFGHCNPEITGAIHKQLEKIEHVLMAGFVSRPALELSELLGKVLPPQLSRIFYSDDGSTSVEVAMKIALQYHHIKKNNRTAFVSLGGGYHGDTLGAMSVGDIPLYHSPFHELFKKQYYTDSPYCYRCPVGKKPQSCSAECMNSLQKILEQHGSEIAACIFEPMVQGAVGMRVYPSKVLKRIFGLCREHEVITIADEVAMGLGRTGRMFACDHAGEVPDLMCLAKGLTGGYLPLAVTAVKEDIYCEFKGDFLSDRTFQHGHTFTGNPLAASAGCAALKLLIDHDLPRSAQNVMNHLALKLETMDRNEHVGGIRHLGFVAAFEIVKNKETKEKFPAAMRIPFKVSQRALKYGLAIRPLGNTVYFMPPYTVTKEELDRIFSLTERAMNEVLDEPPSS